MKVIIPAAGSGSRLRPHTFTTPKSLLCVAGRPIIEHLMDQVLAWGATRVIVIVGHLREKLESALTGRYPVPIEFRTQERPLGLGHAILTGLDEGDGEVLVVLGDTLVDVNLRPVLERKVNAVGLKAVEDPRKFGVAVVQDGRVVKLIEKPAVPPSNLALVGLYYLTKGELLAKAVREVMAKGIIVKGEYQVTDALQVLLDWGERLETFTVDGWFDCGNPDSLLATNRYLLDREGSSVAADAAFTESVVVPPVFVASGVKVTRSVLGPHVAVGKDSNLTDCVVRDSIIGESVAIERAVVAHSLVGNRAKHSGSFQQLNLGASSVITARD